MVRPRLSRRSRRILLAGQDASGSLGHYTYVATYVALEAVKVIALTTGGILLPAA